MKLSLSQIRSFIHLDLTSAQIAETLTLLGIEVDKIINEHPPFSGVVVGEVLSTAPHPNANKLQVAQVSDGKHHFQVVCGDPQCRPGMRTAFAKPGAILYASGKPQTIEACELRGVSSAGMLCSEQELGLPVQKDGIIDLPKEMQLGLDLAAILWDPVFEISLTPNLGHCMSALGIARELSASLQKPMQKTKIALPDAKGSSLHQKLKVSVSDPKLCPRYLCRLVENVSIGPSPFWLQQQLLACGQTPICNVVDIGNFILLKRGQPLHVFDFDKIEGGILRAAPAEAAQTILGLDGIEYEVPQGTLLISDAKKPVAIAGILGADNSAVSKDSKHTHNLLIEAAFFDPATIRKGAKALDLRTESAQRFEKGTDPNGIVDALDEAVSLILEICGGNLASDTIDIKTQTFSPKEIQCRPSRVNKLLGTKLSFAEIEAIFHRLGFGTKEITPEAIRVSVPLFRSDISEEIDLVEEVARIYGYNHIEKGIARSATSPIPHDPAYLFESEVRKRLIALGLQEWLTADLISPKLADLTQEWVHKDAKLLTTLKPKTEEYSILRPSLLPGMMQSAANNFDHKTHTFHAFEIGRIHFLQNSNLIEQPMAAVMLAGKTAPSHWNAKPADVDFFDLKGILENLLDSLHIRHVAFEPSKHLSFHPGRQANLQAGGLLIGSFGEVHPKLLAKLDIKQRLLYAEINLHHLLSLRKEHLQMHPIPKFPASERDWTIPVPLNLPMQTLFLAIQSARPPLLEKAELIDLYIPEGSEKKNACFRFTYRDLLKTVSFEEVEKQHQLLVESVTKALST